MNPLPGVDLLLQGMNVVLQESWFMVAGPRCITPPSNQLNAENHCFKTYFLSTTYNTELLVKMPSNSSGLSHYLSHAIDHNYCHCECGKDQLRPHKYTHTHRVAYLLNTGHLHYRYGHHTTCTTNRMTDNRTDELKQHRNVIPIFKYIHCAICHIK